MPSARRRNARSLFARFNLFWSLLLVHFLGQLIPLWEDHDALIEPYWLLRRSETSNHGNGPGWAVIQEDGFIHPITSIPLRVRAQSDDIFIGGYALCFSGFLGGI
jgi:hypothetical protein